MGHERVCAVWARGAADYSYLMVDYRDHIMRLPRLPSHEHMRQARQRWEEAVNRLFNSILKAAQ